MKTLFNPDTHSRVEDRTVRICRSISLVFMAFVLAIPTDAQNRLLPEGRPETLGFSGEGLKRLDDAMQGFVERKELAGITTLLARHGKLLHRKTFGLQDIATAKPMPMDAIFRLYSMTKPITGVAMMILYEEGKWKPSDPIAKYIPEFTNLKVYAGESEGVMKLEAPAHAPTMGELMSHTAGFTYGLLTSPVDRLYQESRVLQAGSLKEFIDKLGNLPLMYQPGESWVYSVSTDVQGYLVEKLSGKPFPEWEFSGTLTQGFSRSLTHPRVVNAQFLTLVAHVRKWIVCSVQNRAASAARNRISAGAEQAVKDAAIAAPRSGRRSLTACGAEARFPVSISPVSRLAQFACDTIRLR